MWLSEHMHEVPVLLLVCGERDWPAFVPPERRVGKAPPSYGSIYPCIQNILLACRALGLGASLTTTHMLFEDELCQQLGVPDEYGIVAIIPIGYPRGRFGPVARRPAEERTYFDTWGCTEP
jgi:nitroreductase